jgi:hypothetical protein
MKDLTPDCSLYFRVFYKVSVSARGTGAKQLTNYQEDFI